MTELTAPPAFIIHNWDFTHQPAQAVKDLEQAHQNCWFHVQRDLPGISEWLAHEQIPEPLIDAVLEEDTRPRFERLSNGFLLILRGVNLGSNNELNATVSLRLLYYNNNLYSLRKRPLHAVAAMQKKLVSENGPANLGEFLLQLVDEFNNDVEQLVDSLELQLEELDDEQSTSPTHQQELKHLHRRLLRLTRFYQPQVAALERLAADGVEWFDAEWGQWLLNERNNIQRELENMEMLLEQVWVITEHLQQEVAEKMNRNTYWLSMVAGVFLPISFLTGLFGINIGGMPGMEDMSAFWWFSGALFIIAVIEFLLLRRLRFW